MRIGVMLRHLGQHGGGVLVYTRNLLREMLALDSGHEFVFLYRDAIHVGAFGHHPHLEEVVLRPSNVLLWDQVAVPRAAERLELDVIFNPKYSTPLLTSRPTVFVCHGLDWYVEPRWSRWLDRISHRVLIPLYARKADRIIAVSETTREHLHRYLEVSDERTRTIHHGIDAIFHEPVSASARASVRTHYGLPRRYILYVGQIYPPKNFGRLLEAFANVVCDNDEDLVVAGSHTWLSEDEIAMIDRLGIAGRVTWLGWVDRSDLPALYAEAELLVLPSLYESFGLPILEAMASGCPVVTSNRYGTREIAGDAAVLVDPESVESIARGVQSILSSTDKRKQLGKAGRKRAAEFSWKRCAEETMVVLEEAVEVERSETGNRDRYISGCVSLRGKGDMQQ